MRYRLPGLALLGLSIAITAGCTTTSAGTPLPDTASSTEDTPSSSDKPPTADDDLPSDGAPKVSKPFDASRFEESPCDALTSANTDELKLQATGERTDTNFGNGCMWRNPQTGGNVIIAFTSADKRGLSSAYRSNNNDEFAFFEPIDDVAGYPAVAYSTQTAKPTASCSVAVGVTDELSFTTMVGLSAANVGEKDPCEESATVAGMAMRTMLEAS